jgi:hypothetical protein
MKATDSKIGTNTITISNKLYSADSIIKYLINYRTRCLGLLFYLFTSCPQFIEEEGELEMVDLMHSIHKEVTLLIRVFCALNALVRKLRANAKKGK